MTRQNWTNAPLTAPLSPIDTDLEPAYWSPWHERLLTSPDAPDIIRCAVCKLFKHAVAANYRNIRTTDRWRSTCRPCENKTAYHASLRGKMVAIRNDPRIPESARPMAVQAAVVEKKRNKQSSAERERLMAFNAMWKAVATIITHRHKMLATRIGTSRNNNGRGGSGFGGNPGALAWLMQESRIIDAYVNAIRSLYKTITARLRNTQTWDATIKGHHPPQHWLDLVASWRVWDEPSRNAEAMRVSAWEFTTREERDDLYLIHPEKILEAGTDTLNKYYALTAIGHRANGTICFHLRPDVLISGEQVSNMSPQWLKDFNGY